MHFPELHWLPFVHSTHAWVTGSHAGFGALQSDALVQATHVPVAVSHAGFGAVQ
jgi:hypothetical protein